MGAEDRSPSVLMVTSSAGWPLAIRASLTPAAWVVANRLPRVPIRITCANRLLAGLWRRAGVEIAWHDWQFSRSDGGY